MLDRNLHAKVLNIVQMMMACSTRCWPLLQLVSIGCHASMRELVVHLTSMFDVKCSDETLHVAELTGKPSGSLGIKLTSPVDVKVLDAPEDSHLVERVRGFVMQESSPLLHRSISWKASSCRDETSFLIKAANSEALFMSLKRKKGRIRSLAEASKLVSNATAFTIAAKGEQRGKTCVGTTPPQQHASMHEYPVLFIASVANTMLHMVEVSTAPVPDVAMQYTCS